MVPKWFQNGPKIRRPSVGVFAVRRGARFASPLTPPPLDPSATLRVKNTSFGSKTTYPNHFPSLSLQKPRTPRQVSQRVRLGAFGGVGFWVREFGAKSREQARVGSVLTVLRKSHKAGAPFPAHALQIGSVHEVSSIVPALLCKTYGTRRHRTANCP